MPEVIVGSFLFVAIMAISLVLFGGYVVVSVIRGVFRAIFGSCATRQDSIPANAGGVRCPNDRCREINPGSAKFCRRCGTAIIAQRVEVRRVA